MERAADETNGWPLYGVVVILTLMICGFSLFVGYNKALAPFAVLVEHTAWTIHLPVMLGKALGWLEMLAASIGILALPFARHARARTLAVAWIGLNHAVAAVFHIANKEWHTLPQSAVMITLCLIGIALYARRARSV